ncbi:TrbC/VirB2 family protein [Selenomonas ruminantium]|uniref:TrbC/VirB2 family protein n=1 Tax=Selenomonas ruminantium TaxID=971 RepID=UPI0026EF9C61|nr:TrbC/VirB2 family protein [Selenomonas ruminantium]
MKVKFDGVKKFVRKNGVFMAQLAVMGYVAFSGDVAFALEKGNGGGTATFTNITGPLDSLKATLTGPIATAVGTVGIGAAALATGLNMENQVMKRAIQLTGGTAGAIGAGGLLTNVSSGLLF